MLVIGPFLLLLIVALVVYGTTHRAPRPAPMPLARATGDGATVPPTAPRAASPDLDAWVAAGLITAEQRTAILRFEQRPEIPAAPAAPAAPAPEGRPRRIPAIAEALGYLGGMLAVIGLGLIVSRYWPDMATAGRLALSGVVAVALVGAGALTREASDPALARLRWFLWLAATTATALFVGVATLDGLGAAPETVTLACAGAVAVLSGLLWNRHERPLQQLTFLGGLVVTAGALMAELAVGAPIGITAWLVGAALVALGLRRRIQTPILPEAVGALAMLVGAVIVGSDSQTFGLPFLVATSFTLLALALVPDLAPERADQLVLGLLGGLALLQGGPPTLVWFGRDAGGATGLVTWAIGGALVAIGSRGLTRLPLQTALAGGATLLGGAALTGVQWHGFAPLFGVATAIALVGLGTRPGQVLSSMLGSVGLLINVPWAIGWFFPGEGRAPLLIMVSGALIIAIAVLLTRTGGRFRRDLGAMRRRTPPRGGIVPGPSH